jgi:site-specific DNA recombinase
MMKPENLSPRKAVIYCRVGSATSGELPGKFSAQETECREYARTCGYEVVATFTDLASGMRIERPGLHKLQTFLRNERGSASGTVVLATDIDRVARGVGAFSTIRQALTSCGGVLEFSLCNQHRPVDLGGGNGQA